MALAKEEKQQTDLVLKLPVVGPPWLYKANRPPFLSVYRRNNLRGMLGERVFSQHPKWVITPLNR